MAVNKMDSDNAKQKYEELLDSLGNQDVSSLEDDIRPSKIIKFDDIIPIIARDATNTLQVKQKIRSFIDLHVEKQRGGAEIEVSPLLTSHTMV